MCKQLGFPPFNVSILCNDTRNICCCFLCSINESLTEVRGHKKIIPRKSYCSQATELRIFKSGPSKINLETILPRVTTVLRNVILVFSHSLSPAPLRTSNSTATWSGKSSFAVSQAWDEIALGSLAVDDTNLTCTVLRE